jgi:hypothetical protein
MTCYVEVPVFADGGWSDVEQIEVPCDEPPEPEEPYGTAYEDFHPFNAARYEGF